MRKGNERGELLSIALRCRYLSLLLLAALVAPILLLVGCEEGPGTKSEADRDPSFGSRTIANQSYTAGSAIAALVLPASTGGNSPLTYSLAPNVPGLQFTPATRTLSGTPTEAGIHSMTYRVVDSDGDAATLTFALVVTKPAPRDTEPSFGAQTVANQTYTTGTAIVALVLPEATGGDRPLTYSLAPNVPGLQFTPATRTLSGTPTEAAIHSMTYRVVDSDGDAATLTFALVVTKPAPRDTEPSFGRQTVANQTYTTGTAIVALVLPEATGGDSPLTYSLVPNVPGLQFTPATRTLSGTPTEAAIHSMTYRVVDSDGDAATLTFVVRINAQEEFQPEDYAPESIIGFKFIGTVTRNNAGRYAVDVGGKIYFTFIDENTIRGENTEGFDYSITSWSYENSGNTVVMQFWWTNGAYDRFELVFTSESSGSFNGHTIPRELAEVWGTFVIEMIG